MAFRAADLGLNSCCWNTPLGPEVVVWYGIRKPSQTIEDTGQVVPNPTGCLQLFQGTSASVQFWTEKMPFTAHPCVLSPRSHVPLNGTNHPETKRKQQYCWMGFPQE